MTPDLVTLPPALRRRVPPSSTGPPYGGRVEDSARPAVLLRAQSGSPPLRDQVRDELCARIADGRVAPGDRLYENAIAEELGVSRIPVREAIRMLQSEGLVSVQPRRGVLVRRLDRQAVRDLFDIREALDVLAARLAAERAGPEDLLALGEVIEAGRSALHSGDSVSIATANTGFHEEIYRLAGNELIPELLEPLMGRLRWHFSQNREPQRVFGEHEELYRALATHDPDHAAEVALEHVRASRRMVLDMLAD